MDISNFEGKIELDVGLNIIECVFEYKKVLDSQNVKIAAVKLISIL